MLDGIVGSMEMNLSKLGNWRTEEPSMLQSMGSQRIGSDLATEQQNQRYVLPGAG